MSLIIDFIGLCRENWVLLGNPMMSKKLQQNLGCFFKKKLNIYVPYRDLDIVDGHPSMFLLFAFVMIHVNSNSFNGILIFFRNLVSPVQFLAFLCKK